MTHILPNGSYECTVEVNELFLILCVSWLVRLVLLPVVLQLSIQSHVTVAGLFKLRMAV